MSAGARRCAACQDDALPGEAFCGLHRSAFLHLYGVRAIDRAQEEKSVRTKKNVQVVDTEKATSEIRATALTRAQAEARERTVREERAREEQASKKPRDKEAEWRPKARAPEDRVRDPKEVRKLFKRFLDASSTARVDYQRLGADEQAVAGLLQQLALTAFGDGCEGSGFRAVARPPTKNLSKSAGVLFEGAVVRYKKPSEQAEVREDAGEHPIVVVHVGAAFVRVACGAVTFTPKANQIELDPDAAQPPRPGEEVAEEGVDEWVAEAERTAARIDAADGDDVPFGTEEVRA